MEDKNIIKNIITSKNTNYSTFLQCDCGGEILWLYFYYKTSTCEEIIILDYIGDLKDKKEFKYKHFSFTRDNLNSFSNDLISSQDLKTFYNIYEDRGSYLIFEKDELNFYTLRIAKNKKLAIKKKYVWEIIVQPPQLIEFSDEIKKLQSIIKEWDKKLST